jgi:methanogenic corrinoid protein MtbC1
MLLKNNVEVLSANLITHAMLKLDDEYVKNLFQQGIERGADPAVLLEEAKAGVQKISEMYNSGQYFLGDLMVAADIFQDVASMALDAKTVLGASDFPPIIFGTVEEDIHDIGKNITIVFLRSKGFEVTDLGVDVPAAVFADAVRATGSPLLCLSGLITTAFNSMRNTIGLLEQQELRSGVSVVIGGLVNEEVRKYTGADYWVKDCTAGCDICDRIMRSNSLKMAMHI